MTSIKGNGSHIVCRELSYFSGNSGKGTFSVFTFLNKANGGPGEAVVSKAMVLSFLGYAIPRMLPYLFPSDHDTLPFSSSRVIIGRKVQVYVDRRKKLKKILMFLNNNFFLGIFLTTLNIHRLEHRRGSSFSARLENGMAYTFHLVGACILSHIVRIGLHSLALTIKDNGPLQTRHLAERVEHLLVQTRSMVDGVLGTVPAYLVLESSLQDWLDMIITYYLESPYKKVKKTQICGKRHDTTQGTFE